MSEGTFDTMLESMMEPVYTQTDENNSRNMAINEVKSERINNELNQYKKKINDLENMVKQIMTKYDTDTTVLKTKIEQLDKNQNIIKSDTSNIMEDILGGKYNAEVERIKKNDLYKDYFDEKEVLNEMQERHKYGQVLVPAEAFKIRTFDKLAEENKILKDKYATATGERLFDTPFANKSSSNVKKNNLDLSNVNDPTLLASVLNSRFDEL